jgi:CRP-like cAMP-binding protein
MTDAGPREPSLEALLAASLPGSRPASVSLLAESARIRQVRREEVIFRQGDEIPLTLMVSGHSAIRRTTLDGQQIIVGVAYPGEIFGITSVSATVSSVDMVALTDLTVATWRGPEFRRLTENDAGLAMSVIDRMALFLSILTEKLDGFLHQDARRRVIRVLGRHRDLFFSDPPVLTRTHLPGLVGTSREMTGRVLRALEREGVVARVGRAGLRLLDPGQLDSVPETIVEPGARARLGLVSRA